VTKDGYVLVRVDGVWRYEHRVVMERVVGRPLGPDEQVRYRPGATRGDNRPDKLELWASHRVWPPGDTEPPARPSSNSLSTPKAGSRRETGPSKDDFAIYRRVKRWVQRDWRARAAAA
jgi:hypothetical protein